MFASPTEPGIAPSGTLLGLLQRGRGDGTLHALAVPRAEAVAALEDCVRWDPRWDWRVEHRSLYYARLLVELRADTSVLAAHLLDPADGGSDGDGPAEERTGLTLSVLGHLVSYGRTDALHLLRRYAATGANWRWALDELAVRDGDDGLRDLGPAILARFARTPEGDAELATAVRDAFEPRPWHLWAEDSRYPDQRTRLDRARESGHFDRWRRQLHRSAHPEWSVPGVLAWVQRGYEAEPRQWRESAAARCLAAVAGPEHRPLLRAAAGDGSPAVRAAALRHLAERDDEAVLPLLEAAAHDVVPELAAAATAAFARMRGPRALARARDWAVRPGPLGATAAAFLALHGGPADGAAVLSALRRTVRAQGTDGADLAPLVEGAGRLALRSAAPVLRHVYRETGSSRLRGTTAAALAATDPYFAAGFAVECLWDCEEETREVGARVAASADARVLDRLHRLAADPAEQDGVQTAVRGRLGPAT